MADFDEIGELQRRLARIELLTAVLAANPKSDVDAKALSRLRRALRWDRRHPLDDPEVPFLAEVLQRSANENARQSISNLLEDSFHAELQYEQKVDQLTKDTDSLRLQTQKLQETVKQLGRDQTRVQNETHAWLAIQSMGIDTAEVLLTRFIPLRVYLSEATDNEVTQVTSAVTSLADAIDFEICDEFPGVKGSWFQKLFGKTKEVATSEAVADRLSKLERALELKGIALPQAEVDEKLASAVEKLSNATAATPLAAIQLGSILFVKLTKNGAPEVHVRTLSQREIIQLENNQDLLASPQDILQKLTKLCSADTQHNGHLNYPANGGSKKTDALHPKGLKKVGALREPKSKKLNHGGLLPPPSPPKD